MQCKQPERGKAPFKKYASSILTVPIIFRALTNIGGNIIIFHDHKDSKNKVVV